MAKERTPEEKAADEQRKKLENEKKQIKKDQAKSKQAARKRAKEIAKQEEALEEDREGNGFVFSNYNAHEMLATIRYAEKIYYDRKREWNKMVDRAMAADFSWYTSAAKYQEMYDWLIG